MPAEQLRLFLGLWPDEASLRDLQTWVDDLPWPAGAKRTLPQHLHLTLHFLGGTEAARVAPLCAVLPRRLPAIELRFDALQDWGQGLQVLVAAQTPPVLAELHAELAALLRDQGLPVETRPFRPHVTLARKAGGLQAPTPALRWRSRALVLAQSLQGYHPLWQAAVG